MTTDRGNDEGGEAPCFAHLLDSDGTLDTPPASPVANDEPEDDRADDEAASAAARELTITSAPERSEAPR